MSARGTTNRNDRGSTRDRRARKLWLLSAAAGFGGDGHTVQCTTPGCDVVLDFDTITVDRITPGIEGGTYRRDNIRPKCGPHNYGDGGRLSHQRRRARAGVLPLFEAATA